MHNKQNPFLSKIKERYRLSRPGSRKHTFHVVLDLKGSGITYEVGDTIGIFATHDPELVGKTLKALKATGSEVVKEKSSNELMNLSAIFTRKANVTTVSKKCFHEIFQRLPEGLQKEKLAPLFQEERKKELKSYLEHHELWEILTHCSEAHIDPQELCSWLMPLLPRFYSIASSQKAVGDEAHLTIALIDYENVSQTPRSGVCTHYLCRLAPLNEPIVPIYVQPHHGFTLPSDATVPLIMIGPGTGVAPFRAFMQERISHAASTEKHWLFFGEWTRSHEFFYEEFWTSLVSAGKMRLDVAFSRDQAQKVYVQHKMLERAPELFQWIQEGAHLYVCGDAKRMAKDVEETLLKIFQEQGNLEESDSRAFLKKLRTEKRYLRDVY